MRYFIFGSNCDVSYTRVEEILDKYIKKDDEIITVVREGVNEYVAEYAARHNIKYKVYEDAAPKVGQAVQYQFAKFYASSSDRCLFIFSQIEPPELNYAYKAALEVKIIDDILYDFV